MRFGPLSRSRAVAALLPFLAGVAVAAPAAATPANVPSAATAQSELNALAVSPEGSTSGYDRDLFPHWSAVSGSCNTRETVLKRDGTGVTVDAACYPTAGSWFSEFDGVWTSPASAVDIDHIVPLAEAWRSGANAWSTATRQAFANELYWPELMAVTRSSNSAKGDKDPSTWQPLSSYRCRYARMWIRVKHRYSLRLQSSEKSALQGMLNTC